MDSKLFLTCCIYTYRLMQYCEERRSFELFPICINDISINVNSKVLFILKLIN